MTVEAGRLLDFRAQFALATDDIAAERAGETLVDVALEPDLFDLPSARDLGLLEPLGAANVEPMFLLPEARVSECGVVAGAHLKLELKLGSRTLRAFGYDMAPARVAAGDAIRALGHLRPDTWTGGDRVELRLRALEVV